MRLPNGRPPRMDLYGHNPFTLRRPALRQGPLGLRLRRLLRPRHARAVGRSLPRPAPRGRPIRLFLSEFTLPDRPRELRVQLLGDRGIQARWLATRASHHAPAGGGSTRSAGSGCTTNSRTDPAAARETRSTVACSNGTATEAGLPGVQARLRAGLTAGSVVGGGGEPAKAGVRVVRAVRPRTGSRAAPPPPSSPHTPRRSSGPPPRRR